MPQRSADIRVNTSVVAGFRRNANMILVGHKCDRGIAGFCVSPFVSVSMMVR
jgi:hypothetical protein